MRYVLGLLPLLLSLSAVANTAPPIVDAKKLNLQKSYLEAIDCRVTQRLTDALQQSLQTNDLTAKGHHASVFEELMMHNPACFIHAANKLPAQVCEQVAASYIHETFFYPRSDIRRSLASAKNYRDSCLAS